MLAPNVEGLILYSTAGCHLCEQAQALLTTFGLQAQVIDIMQSNDLLARYGERIPVLANNKGQELGWPFDDNTLQAWINNSAC